ncbi:MAG TPA: hypothetical protein VJH25_00870 [Candidatus Paceibacterota bacterium]
MKRIIILKHGGGELANQLWNYVNIYAYGLEIDTPVKNPSFFEYHSFFQLIRNESFVTKLLSRFFRTPRRRSHIINKIVRFKYSILAKIKRYIHAPCIVSSENSDNKVIYLPPSGSVLGRFGKCVILYLTGWLFRNPIGIEKWRSELLRAFAPNQKIMTKIDGILLPLRQKYEKIVGVHIRQGDYAIFKGGKYLVSQERIREIVSEYAKENILDARKTVFMVASDGAIDQGLYKNLNVYFSKENAVTDLFLLARADIIIGSDSSFGAFASWYGDIPHIIAKRESMDWDYYRGRASCFRNKYATLV